MYADLFIAINEQKREIIYFEVLYKHVHLF